MGKIHTSTTVPFVGRSSRRDAPCPGVRRHAASKSVGVPILRTYHLIDLENLQGDPGTRDGEAVSATLGEYIDQAGYQPGDLGVLSANTQLLLLAGTYARKFRLKLALRGASGAGLMLLREGIDAVGTTACNRLVIGSGNEAFVPLARHFRSRGVNVVVVTRPGAYCRLPSLLLVGGRESFGHAGRKGAVSLRFYCLVHPSGVICQTSTGR